MLRFSLAALLCVVLAASVGCAALTNPGPLWSQIVFTATVVLLLTATAAAVVARPRPFAAGFAIFGWGYLVLVSGPWALKPHLLTSAALTRLEPLVIDPQATAARTYVPGGGYGAGDTIWLTAPTWNSQSVTTLTARTLVVGNSDAGFWLHQIGHSLWAIIFGVGGGVFARFLAVHQPLGASPRFRHERFESPENQVSKTGR